MSRMVHFGVRAVFIVALISTLSLAGCSGWNPYDQSAENGSSYSKTPDGYYRVRKGDTLHAIAFKFGMDWRQIANVNGISSPYTIYPDQELRLSSTGSSPSGTTTRSGGGRTVVTAAPSKNSTSTTVDVPPRKAESTPAPAVVTKAPPAATKPAPASTSKPVPSRSADPGKWIWPVAGRIISNFSPNDPARKGIDIGGKEGEPVVASAAGEVVYSGSGLIGYGELVIIKHNERLLSAYAHNQKRLVTEGQSVTSGERIATMGRNDRNQAMLHFEIRLDGNPQDPLKYLPSQ
jgi:lipoprotein NlpD